MARLPRSPFTTIRSEGALLPPELLSRIADSDKELPGLAPSDYWLAPTERAGEAISRSWNRLIGLWATFEPQLAGFNPNDPGTGAARDRWLMPLLSELGFAHLPVAKAIEIEGTSYPISHQWEQVPVHLIGAGLDLDRRTPGVAGAARTSPHSLVQDYLNRTPTSLWGMLSNGKELRLLRDNVSLTRQAFLSFDLEAMFSGETYSDFALLWLICHRSRFETEEVRPEECILERWAEAARTQGTRALETLRGGVEEAIRSLGVGFLAHPANERLKDKLRSGELSTQDYYRQLLRLVYRLMFLFVAEDRDLLHAPGSSEQARATYATYYSTARLRYLAERRRGTKHADLWRGLQVVMAALGADEGAPELGLTFLGSFLFSPGACPDLDPAECSNTHLLSAIRALAFTQQGRTLRQIDYRNMGSEELGSIYESLLELHPEIHAETATFELASAAGHERKTTGSYYTPTSLISALLDSTLDPVLVEAAGKGEEAILSLKVLDPACGSGHFLTAAAHRIAKRLASVRTDEPEPAPDPYRTALRDVIGRCVFGIDVNPMATELCKVSLWMEAVEPGKPLSFLDHHIVCGNSLLGTTPKLLAGGIPDEAFKALEGDDKEVVKSLKARNKQERKGQATLFGEAAALDLIAPIAERLANLEATADDSPEAVHERELAWRSLEASKELGQGKLIADAWCAAFVIDKAKGAPILTEGVFELLQKDPDGGDPMLHEAIDELAAHHRFLHPHLAFPQVFRVPTPGEEPDNPEQGWSSGFDVVVGNPPWEKTTVLEREFFRALPHIAEEKRSDKRKRLIASLVDDDPNLYRAWMEAKRGEANLNHFLRSSGRFPGTAVGELNLYPLFVELAAGLARRVGRVGLVVKTGMLLSSTWAEYCARLLEEDLIRAAYDFRNWRGWFPDVGYHERFTLLTLGGTSRSEASSFGFYLDEPTETRDSNKVYAMSSREAIRLNPITKSIPAFDSPQDKDIVTDIYRRFPILASAESQWGVRYTRGFDMSIDAAKFHDLEELQEAGFEPDELYRMRRGESGFLPLYEGKFIQQFDHRFGSFGGIPRSKRFGIKPGTHTPTQGEKADPRYHITPRYWVSDEDGQHNASQRGLGDQWAIAFRDTTNVISNTRTSMACLSANVAYSNTAPNVVLDPLLDAPRPQIALLFVALMNSFAFDYVVRQKFYGAHFLKSMLIQTAVPRLDSVLGYADFILPRALELTYTSTMLEPLAFESGYRAGPFGWGTDRRLALRAELDAILFRIYGLDRATASHILDSYRILRKTEEEASGEYRTKRRILDRFDA